MPFICSVYEIKRTRKMFFTNPRRPTGPYPNYAFNPVSSTNPSIGLKSEA